MRVQLRGALGLQVTDRIKEFRFVDVHPRCGMMANEQMCIRRTSPDAVSEHPQPSRVHHIIGHVLIRIARHRLRIHLPLAGGDVVQILRDIDLVAQTFNVGRVRILYHNDRAPKRRRGELPISMSNPLVVLTLTGSPKLLPRISSMDNSFLSIC